MPLSKFEIKRIEKIVSQYCENKVPPHVRDQLQTTYKIIKNEVWIYEKRPIWNNPSEWREFPVAKAKFTLKTKLWTLYWQDRNLRWHIYDMELFLTLGAFSFVVSMLTNESTYLIPLSSKWGPLGREKVYRCQSWNLPGPVAKQPSPQSGQMMIYVWRLPQPSTPIVNSACWIPCIKGPCGTGCTTSLEIKTPCASGQFNSNFPLFTPVCMAVGCLLSRNCCWVAHPLTIRQPMSARSMYDFAISDLLFIEFVIFISLFRQHQRRRFSTGHHSRNQGKQ